jgi:hypothetical protein
MRGQLLVRKWKLSEELRWRTHSSSVESPLVEVERRFLVWTCVVVCAIMSCPSVVLDFCNACESCSRGNHLGLGGCSFDTDAHT